MYRVFKAVMDRILAFFGLLVLFLPLLIVALAIKLDSKGPAIFKQERIGKDEKPFLLYKFRTMKSTDVKFDIEHPVIADNNENLTKVGRVIRKFKIDEFLQLINVLKGDMSLIGPRPLLVRYLPYYTKDERRRHDVRPGLTGLAQVNGGILQRFGVTPSSMPQTHSFSAAFVPVMGALTMPFIPLRAFSFVWLVLNE